MHRSHKTMIILAGMMLAGLMSVPEYAFAQSQPAFVAPPRTIADITAILDQQKPDPETAAKMQRAAQAQPPAGAGGAKPALFYYDRSHARDAIGQTKEALADAIKARDLARNSLDLIDQRRVKQQVALLHWRLGDPKSALSALLPMLQEHNQPGNRGGMINTYRLIVEQYILLGDFNRAEANLRSAQALMPQLHPTECIAFRRAAWNGDIEIARAILLEARGQFREAEAAYKRGESWKRQQVVLRRTCEQHSPPAEQIEALADMMLSSQGRMKARQGRIAEGEADVRRALLSRLKATGKYNLRTIDYVGILANLMIEQGRFAEAEQLARTQLEIQETLGVGRDTQKRAGAINQLASILNLQGRWAEAAKVYDELDEAIKNWEPARRDTLALNTDHVATLYNTGNLQAGLAAAERLLAWQRSRLGEQHIETALTRGLVAIGYARGSRDADALREFKSIVPILISRSRETDDDDPTVNAAREQRVQSVIENYIALLARVGQAAGLDAAGESFRLADTVRGRSVQRALAASSARTVAAKPALAELVRKAQDLEMQIGAQLGLLNNVLALPPQERDDEAVKSLQADIEKMRTARDAAKRDMAGRFPQYSSLLEPVSPSVDDIRGVLRTDEAFVSFYFGRDNSFVWAVSKTGPVAFAAIGESAAEIDKKVQVLREALEPNASIPAFDVALAHELYTLLLKPVETGWKPAKNLIVATNGALGLLPLGLLPTAPTTVKSDTEPDSDADIALRGLTRGPGVDHLAGYRNVPWLARTHAVTLMPSASALLTLRQLPAGSDKRQPMIGFGDPLFNQQQAAEARMAMDATMQTADVTMRGLALKRRAAPQTRGVDSAQLGLLPRLPDTADELKSIALALQADPSKVLNLGKAANEAAVKNADLSKYRIIVFATHGLVPGDLDGLHQPALALSAPDVAGVPGDGLLTMEEILALKLDADWVVLSACNTDTGAGAGAEAASGLGRAFFYAGTRAILVTNWPVHSASARELVSDMFARQSADPKLTRGEALRQAMMALLDGPRFTNANGKTLFPYDHPLFWAPHTIIGDGGGN
jgi:CHAT domain-containing protein